MITDPYIIHAFKCLEIWQTEEGRTDSEGVQWPSVKSIDAARAHLVKIMSTGEPCGLFTADFIGGICSDNEIAAVNGFRTIDFDSEGKMTDSFLAILP